MGGSGGCGLAAARVADSGSSGGRGGELVLVELEDGCCSYVKEKRL
jgi:hypothetical protein